jgi:anaerobic ribonucleoside-triphosphate reductase activating protein
MPVERLLAHLVARHNCIDGLSVLGGEPTEQPEAVAALLRGTQALGLSTVLFTGRTLESLQRDPICADLLAYTDLLIDGPYLESQQDLALHWRGSRNQRLLRLTDRFKLEDLQAPAAHGEILLSSQGAIFHGIGTRVLVEG